jgi:hypothetical protein
MALGRAFDPAGRALARAPQAREPFELIPPGPASVQLKRERTL